MTKLITCHICIFTISAISLTSFTYADVPPSQKPEVKHLLQFVETTDCIFERNGKKYDGEKASKHIKRKYKYFRDEITTTEEFIEYCATKSTVSGKSYLVYCDDTGPIESSVWLLQELAEYREQRSST